MWTVELRGTGMDSIAETQRDLPRPAAGQLLVKMNAASINYRDLALIRGDYGGWNRYPMVPVSDGAGVVATVGDGVASFREGDRVIPVMRPFWQDGIPSRFAVNNSLGGALDGILSEYVVVAENAVVRTPSHLSDEEAATLPIAAVTAWTGLVEDGPLREGQTVVVQGTGGVSIFALQFASRLGARVIVLSSSDEKLERARALGAAEVVNYRTTPEWQERVLELTGGEGADHILDVGGAATFDRSLDAIRPGGTIYLIGFLGGTDITLNLPKAFSHKVVLRALSVGSRGSFERMNAAIEKWQLRPVVDHVYPRRDLVKALGEMEAGKMFGKIAMTL